MSEPTEDQAVPGEIIGMSMLSVLRCGKITMEDDFAPLLQNVDLEQARQIAEWLVLATGQPAELHWMTIGHAEEILVTPEQMDEKLRQLRARAPRR